LGSRNSEPEASQRVLAHEENFLLGELRHNRSRARKDKEITMIYRSVIVAFVFGLSSAAAWAGTESGGGNGAQQTQERGHAAEGPSAASDWQYVNGSPTPSDKEMGSNTPADLQNAGSADEQDQAADSGSSQAEQQSSDSTNRNTEADQSVGIQGLPDGIQDKLVVILPNDWQGSLPDLLAALERTSESAEILVLKRQDQDEGDSAENSDEDDDDT
jgi:hypothetical protein